MHIDEKLAWGLTRQLITWLPEDLSKARDECLPENYKFLSLNRAQIKHLQAYIKIAYEKFALVFLEGGSKRNPYTNFVGLNVKKERVFGDHIESGFFGVCASFDFVRDRLYQHQYTLPYVIGEHALQRVFKRSGIVNEGNVKNPYSIIHELTLIPFWASLWHFVMTHDQNFDLSLFKKLNMSIPSPNGLFKAHYASYGEDTFVEIRTYYPDSFLKPPEKRAKEILLSISKGIDRSLMSACTVRQINSKQTCANEFFALIFLTFHRIRKYQDEISKMLTKNLDGTDRNKFMKIFSEFYEGGIYQDQKCAEEFASYLENLLDGGYEKFSYAFINPNSELKALLERL